MERAWGDGFLHLPACAAAKNPDGLVLPRVGTLDRVDTFLTNIWNLDPQNACWHWMDVDF